MFLQIYILCSCGMYCHAIILIFSLITNMFAFCEQVLGLLQHFQASLSHYLFIKGLHQSLKTSTGTGGADGA
jgi:hypothetical protein